MLLLLLAGIMTTGDSTERDSNNKLLLLLPLLVLLLLGMMTSSLHVKQSANQICKDNATDYTMWLPDVLTLIDASARACWYQRMGLSYNNGTG